MLNSVTYMGRLVEDPTLRHTKSEIPVASFRLAVQRDYAKEGEPETDFFDVVAWRNLAEFICNHFTKGKMICVQGRNQNRSWKDQYEQNRVTTELVAERAYFADSRKDSVQAGPMPDPFDDGDDDIPF